MSAPRFRFQAKAALLTYPQCASTKEALMLHLNGLLPKPNYVIVCQELHEDGNFHLHAVVTWSSRIDRDGPVFFKFGEHVCNIQSCRSVKKSVEYVMKDGNFIEEGVSPLKKNGWALAIDCATQSDFMTAVAETSPRDFVLNLEKLEYFASKKFGAARLPYVTQYQFNLVDPVLLDWYNNEFKGTHDRRKSLVLYGASRLGKTEWARSLGHHMYFNSIANFKDDWDDTAEYIIFDDFGIKFIPNRKGFFGGQREFQISGKYMKIKSIKWNKVCIYLCNTKPDYEDDTYWFSFNVIEHCLLNKLF